MILFFLFAVFSFTSNVEGLTNIDCSKCQVNPSSGNCIQIKDISYIPNNNTIDFKVIDTSYVFCPWTPKCDICENLIEQSERLELSKDDIKSGSGIKNNIQCCPDDTFYKTHTIDINMLPKLQSVKTTCRTIDSDMNNGKKYSNQVSRNDYLELRALCNQADFSYSGLYFSKEVDNSGNILKDPNLSVKEIIDYQNILELKLDNMDEETKRIKTQELTNLNNELTSLDLTYPPDVSKKQEIQNRLANDFFISTISYETFQYKLLNTNDGTPLGEAYILQENQFFNCFGNIENIQTFEDINFNQEDLQKFNDENYFDVDANASYTTMQDNVHRPYPSVEDFEMELRNMPSIQESGNVSSGVISTYLNSINSFYQKQFDALIAPRSHSVSQSLQFDNDSLSTKANTFLTYNNSVNTDFDCEPSVTGHDKFKYCGPTPYFNEFKH